MVFVSDLLGLRTEEEWEDVRQRISDLPQDEALTAELTKVRSTALFICSSRAEHSSVYSRVNIWYLCLTESDILQIGCWKIFKTKAFGNGSSYKRLFVSGSTCHLCSLFQRRDETRSCWPCCSHFHQACNCHQGNGISH